MYMRLDKFLSQTGKFTRAEAKKVIKSKRVRLNGEVVKDGKIKINEDSDKIFLDGELLALNNKEVYYMLNKPVGVVSATKDDKDKTVIDLIDSPGRKEDLFPVGRLDKETTGLLIITNDGKFAHNIISPKKHIPKTYEAVVTGKISEKEVKIFSQGMELANGDKLQPAHLDVISYSKKDDTSKVRVIIHEGKYHQVRRMFGAVSQRVLELDRVKIGLLELDDTLERGEYRELTEKELNLIK
ncbi:rRNA pseudouridine synthase [Lactobacillus salivarius]|nr:rRNA pseudouridine synthase [Ligilactobacillus salivarius]MYU59978.1 rRNA pseudouridine synthase [Ligilactobacillus salivarius]MYU83449.1 rRNA pseudouridine synthase [Ligilactobacillus salivarius]MYU85204.1 rRNA pseudouridine synthase [Ligilactobacillus salivarius]MYU86932.1 rRNA pseudouridine synthase [Ligilactobacillus salivarius]